MDQVTQFVEPAKAFTKDSLRLVKRCTKPDRKGENLVAQYFLLRSSGNLEINAV